VNDELERMWKQAVIAEVSGTIPEFFLESLRKTTLNLSQDSRSPVRDLISGPPKYEVELLTTLPQRLVQNVEDEYLLIVFSSHNIIIPRNLQ
jgi:hypothetical protein